MTDIVRQPSNAAAATDTRPARRPVGTAVSLRGLTRTFGAVRALDEMNLDLAPGELVVLLGPSGCGKTTALRILAGLEDADSGSVVVAGRDITGIPASRRDMGMVFQAYSLFPHMTAQENVEFGLQLRHIDRRERRRTASEYLELVGLSDQSGRYAGQLSGGQQQRVALARALAIRPQVLLLDEPLSALDAKVRVQLREEIRRIQIEVGTTTLFVTHDQEEALAVADRVGVMRAGHLEQIAEPQEIYARPASVFVAEFVGSSNRMAGVCSGDTAHVLRCTVPLLAGSPTSGDATVFVRPEAVTLLDPSGREAEGLITAEVTTTSFRGAYGHATVRLDDGATVVAQHDAAAIGLLHLGARVAVRVEPVPALASAAA